MSAGDIPIGDFSYPVTTDMSAAQAGQFSAVYLASTTIALATNGIQKMLGILQDNPNGYTKATVGSVRELGHSKCWVDNTGGAITAGDALIISSTNPGMLCKATGAITDVVGAIAVEGNGGVVCIIEVALTNRVAEGGASRAGQLVYSIPMVNFGVATPNTVVLTGLPLGFIGTITDMYAVVTTASTISTTTTQLTLQISAKSAITYLTLPVTYANAGTIGLVLTSTKTLASEANNTFIATDTLKILSTPAGTSASEAGKIELHIITN